MKKADFRADPTWSRVREAYVADHEVESHNHAMLRRLTAANALYDIESAAVQGRAPTTDNITRCLVLNAQAAADSAVAPPPDLLMERSLLLQRQREAHDLVSEGVLNPRVLQLLARNLAEIDRLLADGYTMRPTHQRSRRIRRPGDAK